MKNTEAMYDWYMSNNVSLAETAKKFGMSASGLRKRFKKVGLKCKGRNSTREVKINEAELKRLYCDEYMSIEELSKYFGASKGTIWNRINALDINRPAHISKMNRSDNYHVWTEEFLERAKEEIARVGLKKAASNLSVSYNALQLINKAKIGVAIRTWDKEDEREVRTLLEQYKDYDKVAELTGIDREKIYLKNNRSWHIDLSANSNLYGIWTKGKDGVMYQSKLEAKFANRLFDAGLRYERQVKVCDDRKWTCDFKIGDVWIEVDGLGASRDQVGDTQYLTNEKIKYYKSSGLNFRIVDDKNFDSVLAHMGAPKVIDWKPFLVEIRSIEYSTAKFFCSRYHYSGTCPHGDKIRLGFFVKDRLCGVITFGPGTNRYLISSLSTLPLKGLELTRLCILPIVKRNFASFMIGRAKRLLKNDYDIIVTFADPEFGHVGYIYQAANFIYTGRSRSDYIYELQNGKRVHKSKFRRKHGLSERKLAALSGAEKVNVDGKHRYLCVLRNRKSILRSLNYKSLPYPKGV